MDQGNERNPHSEKQHTLCLQRIQGDSLKLIIVNHAIIKTDKHET
jgi:hypothetical protein